MEPSSLEAGKEGDDGLGQVCSQGPVCCSEPKHHRCLPLHPLGTPSCLSSRAAWGYNQHSLALPVSLVSSPHGQIPMCHRERPTVTFPCSQSGRRAARSTLHKYDNESVNDAC